MFFGHIVTFNKPYEFSESNVDEKAGEVLSITNVVLAPNSKVIPILLRKMHPSMSKIKKDNSL